MDDLDKLQGAWPEGVLDPQAKAEAIRQGYATVAVPIAVVDTRAEETAALTDRLKALEEELQDTEQDLHFWQDKYFELQYAWATKTRKAIIGYILLGAATAVLALRVAVDLWYG